MIGAPVTTFIVLAVLVLCHTLHSSFLASMQQTRASSVAYHFRLISLIPLFYCKLMLTGGAAFQLTLSLSLSVTPNLRLEIASIIISVHKSLSISPENSHWSAEIFFLVDKAKVYDKKYRH